MGLLFFRESKYSEARMRRALHGRSVIAGIVLVLAFAWSANATTIVTTDYITSGFNSGGTDGWTATGATVAYSTAVPPGNSTLPSLDPGINPGFLDVQDSQNKPMVLVAPSAFSGDLSRFLDKLLYFDAFIRQISGGPGATVFPEWGIVTIAGTVAGSAFSASYDVGTVPTGATTYQRFYAPLSASAWYVGTTATGTHTTAPQFAELLANVSAISVTASLRQSSSDDLAFDNFTINGVPEPATFLLIGSALVVAAAARRRIKK
jgi:hypothetical protein